MLLTGAATGVMGRTGAATRVMGRTGAVISYMGGGTGAVIRDLGRRTAVICGRGRIGAAKYDIERITGSLIVTYVFSVLQCKHPKLLRHFCKEI